MADIAVGQFVQTEEFLADEKVVDMDSEDPEAGSRLNAVHDDDQQGQLARSDPGEGQLAGGAVRQQRRSRVDCRLHLRCSARSRRHRRANAVGRNRTCSATCGRARRSSSPAVGGNGASPSSRPGAQCPRQRAWSGDKLLFIGSDAQKQGADPAADEVQPADPGLQLHPDPSAPSGTSRARRPPSSYYGGREPAKEAARKLVEHKRKLENNGFFGAREFVNVHGRAPTT